MVFPNLSMKQDFKN